jgi:Alpha amylase, catalytic domain
MKPRPKHPLIYEINTWVWLQELGKGRKAPVTLATVPQKEWDAIAALGFDAVWLMGVWERSPAGIAVSMGNPGLLEDFRRALPDFTEADNVGSPYCVRNYLVDSHLGGPNGLAIARRELAERGLGLILDFVPNHVAPDHPWVTGHPDYFIQGTLEEAVREPAAFLSAGGQVFACGRDPFFPAWPDVLQLNAFDPGLRGAAAVTVNSIADQCDGVRCDMAMLMINDIFQRTWGKRAGEKPEKEYWPELIGAVRTQHPGFIFMAEAYWDLEWQLQQQGFDYCYDKKLYDRMEHGPAENVRMHLCADRTYQEGMVRFIENHDEPRAAAAFPPEKARAAALIAATLPGAALLHEGQLEGRTVRLPVFLARRLDEPVDTDLRSFYNNLLGAIAGEGLRKGEWHLCERWGWPDNQSCQNILTWCWAGDDARSLILVNFSDVTSQALIRVPWDQLRDTTWRLEDLLSSESFERSGHDMRDAGLYVEMGPWECHMFRVCAVE